MVEPLSDKTEKPKAQLSCSAESSFSDTLARLSLGTREALVSAIETGDEAKLLQSLNAGADLNWKDGGALGLAVRLRKHHLIRHLITPGARVPEVVLSEIVEREESGAIAPLTAAGASYLDEHGRCPFLQRIMDADLEDGKWAVEAIIKSRPNVSGITLDPYSYCSLRGDSLSGWLECDGLDGLSIRLDKGGYNPQHKSIEEQADGFMTSILKFSDHEPGAQLLQSQCLIQNPTLFKEPAYLLEWLRAAQYAWRDADSQTQAIKVKGMLDPLVKRVALHIDVPHEELWNSLQSGIKSFLRVLQKHRVDTVPIAQTIVRLASDAGGDHKVFEQVVEADRIYRANLPEELPSRNGEWGDLRIEKVRLEYESPEAAFKRMNRGSFKGTLEEIQKALRIGNWNIAPAACYLQLITRATSPDSELFGNKLLRNGYRLLFDQNGVVLKNGALRFLSTCAAASAQLGSARIQESIFRDLVEQGMRRCDPGTRKPVRLLDVTQEYNQAFDGLADVRDVMSAFSSSVFLPMLTHCHHEAHDLPRLPYPEVWHEELVGVQTRSMVGFRELAYEVLFRGRALLEISRLNRAWHRSLRNHPTSHGSEAEWHPAISETRLSNDYTVVALTSSRQLKAEGEAMNNCLRSGLYESACMSGRLAILSMRYRGIPVVSLTLSRPQPMQGWYITEFQGANHTAPTLEQLYMIQELRRRLTLGQIPLWRAGWGLTEKSKASLKMKEMSQLERIFNVSLREYPKDALYFYSEVVTINHDGKRRPLLRTPDLQAYVPLVHDILRNPRDF